MMRFMPFMFLIFLYFSSPWFFIDGTKYYDVYNFTTKNVAPPKRTKELMIVERMKVPQSQSKRNQKVIEDELDEESKNYRNLLGLKSEEELNDRFRLWYNKG